MDVEVEGVQFEDDFEINEKDPDGKKFDRGESNRVQHQLYAVDGVGGGTEVGERGEGVGQGVPSSVRCSGVWTPRLGRRK